MQKISFITNKKKIIADLKHEIGIELVLFILPINFLNFTISQSYLIYNKE
jgi:hypothetical protein